MEVKTTAGLAGSRKTSIDLSIRRIESTLLQFPHPPRMSVVELRPSGAVSAIPSVDSFLLKFLHDVVNATIRMASLQTSLLRFVPQVPHEYIESACSPTRPSPRSWPDMFQDRQRAIFETPTRSEICFCQRRK